jgi:hypothetical protein
MPCVPIGMTVTCGRTSRLNRFLSMPRYDGASRRRMKRGLPTHVLTAHVQASDPHGAVRAELELPSATCALGGAGLSTSSRGTRPAAFERKVHLATRHSDRKWPTRRPATCNADIVAQPGEHSASRPADLPAAKSLFSRKSPEERQCSERPTMAPRQPRDVMGAQELLIGRKSFIDPLGERHALGAPTTCELRSGLVDGHDGFGSCVVPAV